jgi:glycosyltransferase involved in cell wall biosynthesis
MDLAKIKELQDLAEREISLEEHNACQELLKSKKVAVFVVAYNAERHLENVIARIPPSLFALLAEIVVIDDSSGDATFEVASRLKKKYESSNLTVYRTPFNRGYGGNQKLGYLYCIEKNYDIVILLHGDGQYAPEFIPKVLAAFDEQTDAVFASRMMRKRMALKGGMPLYKWLGNQLLTSFENKLLGLHLSEFHTGFRAYRVATLRKIPFELNSDSFHFDTEIIVQAAAMGWKIKEVSIPTYYGDEQCHVNGIKYAYNCAKAVLKYQLVNMGLFYQRNYDFGLFEADRYHFKRSENSLHQYVLRNGDFRDDMTTVELGANRGVLSSYIAPRVQSHLAVDYAKPDLAGQSISRALDLNTKFSQTLAQKKFDSCVALDVIEHLDRPEDFLSEVFNILKLHGKLYISTANICYLAIRLSLLLGQFNYGKRGILDMTHKRLFSVSAFCRLLRQYNFRIEKVRGFPPPIADLVSNRPLFRFGEKIHGFLSRLMPNLFAYNFLVVATRMDGISDIFEMTLHTEKVQRAIDQDKIVALPLRSSSSSAIRSDE